MATIVRRAPLRNDECGQRVDDRLPRSDWLPSPSPSPSPTTTAALATALATQGYALLPKWLDVETTDALRRDARLCAFEPSRVISGGKRVVDATRTDEICWLRPESTDARRTPALDALAKRLRTFGDSLGGALAALDETALRRAPAPCAGLRRSLAATHRTERCSVARSDCAHCTAAAPHLGSVTCQRPPARAARVRRR